MLTGLSKPSSGLSPINTAYTHENGDSGLQLFKAEGPVQSTYKG